MKRWLLLGTLLAVASFATGCMTCGGHGMCGMTPMNCYSSCDPCGGGYVAACPTRYVSPYAGQFYSGDECSPCGGCVSGCGGCGESFHPFARWCNLISMGGNRCGCGETYIGDYINNPPSLCNPCDQFGGLAGFSAQCSTGMCSTGMCDTGCYSAPMSYSMPYAPMSPQVTYSSSASGCTSCNQGNTFYTSQQARPQPQVQPLPIQQNMMVARNQPPKPQQMVTPQQPMLSQRQMIPQQPMTPQQPMIIAQTRQAAPPRVSPQPVLQDKLVTAGSQQVNYRMTPVRQVAVGGNEQQFGSSSKVIQPATIPANGRVVHAN